jgi:hypothetical protein
MSSFLCEARWGGVQMVTRQCISSLIVGALWETFDLFRNPSAQGKLLVFEIGRFLGPGSLCQNLNFSAVGRRR